MDGQVWTTELRRRRNRRSIHLDHVVIITDQGRVPPRKKKMVDRDRIYDAAMRGNEERNRQLDGDTTREINR